MRDFNLSEWALRHRSMVLFMMIVLLAGAFLRWAALEPLSHMINYDEAYYATDGLSLIQQPRLTPFFPANDKG